MRSLWSGAISFGLVTIPVKLYSATERQDLKFNYLHKQCHTPIRYAKFCPTCQKEVEQEDIVRGFEYAKGQYIVLTEEDFAGVAIEATKTIDILDFVDLVEIDPIFFDKSYYLEAVKPGIKAYQLLKQAMEQTQKIAIAKVVIRSKQVLAAIRSYQKIMTLETMFFPAEIRPITELTPVDQVQINDRELAMAKQLIESLSTKFEPQRYQNDYREALMHVIEAKISGNEGVVAAEQPISGEIMDLMKALEASLKAAEAQTETREEEHAWR